MGSSLFTYESSEFLVDAYVVNMIFRTMVRWNTSSFVYRFMEETAVAYISPDILSVYVFVQYLVCKLVILL